MYKMRSIIREGFRSSYLIAETFLSESDANKIRTRILLGIDEPIKLKTTIYWFYPGEPPKPVLLDNPAELVGYIPEGNYVTNTTSDIEWTFNIQPFNNVDGGVI